MTDRQLRPGLDAGLGRGSAPAAEGMVPGRTTLVDQLAARTGSGFPVPSGLLQRAEKVTGADLSGVRLHAGGDSAAAASSVGARAYALGQDVHFGAGNYQPGTTGGDRLIAHELAHTAQQQGAATGAQYKLEVSTPGDTSEREADRVADSVVGDGAAVAITPRTATIARDTDPSDPGPSGWGAGELSPAYKTPRTANYQDTEAKRGPAVEEFRTKVQNDPDKLASASSLAPGGTKVTSIHLEPADIYYIVGQHIDDIGKGREDKVQVYLDRMVEAFRIMKIDTVEAMALYIAHSAGETMFAYLTEGQVKDDVGSKHPTPDDQRQAFLDDPDKLHESTDPRGPLRYTNKADQAHFTVDPASNIDAAKNPTYKDTFIGRGPVQVTHDYEYVKCLVILEEMAKTAAPKDRALIDEAVVAIKADPRQAANPKYSFLFSTAFMHEAGGVKASASVNAGNASFGGKDAASSWVAGGGFDIYANYDAANAALNAAKASGDPEAVKKAMPQYNEWAGHRSRALIKSAAYGRAVERLKQIIAKQAPDAAANGQPAAPSGQPAAPAPYEPTEL